jgi:NSS family neurotransmitter:Na+ symporter
MASTRGEFSSRFGFVMAAAGSAVGLGNIWGFPTQAASNGGAAFLLVYLILAFTLAYPALMAELIIGRHAHANAVNALRLISTGPATHKIGTTVGVIGFIVAGMILSFYAIVAGWMISFCLASLAGCRLVDVLRYDAKSLFHADLPGTHRRHHFRRGARGHRALVSSFDAPAAGQPDQRALSPKLIIAALGSAFFSLSLGVGTMLIYGSYISDEENLPVVGGLVTTVDIMIAVIAGFLVLPAMYVALHNGVEIFTASGALISEDTLIFTVLPELFATMGLAGIVVSIHA